MPDKLSFQTEKFSEHDVRELQSVLTHITQIADVSWTFTEDGLTVKGLCQDPVTFTHRKSAFAGLEGFMMGYDIGFKNGRFHSDD